MGGVNMANVVAVAQNGTAISTLSNPDGSFQIQGVPPGQYYVYAGPLPPPQRGETYPDNVVPPQDSQGNPFPAQTTFDTEFFGGTRNLAQTGVVTVSAGAVSPPVNFNLQQTPGPAISLVESSVTSALTKSPYHRRRCWPERRNTSSSAEAPASPARPD